MRLTPASSIAADINVIPTIALLTAVSSSPVLVIISVGVGVAVLAPASTVATVGVGEGVSTGVIVGSATLA